MRDITTVSGVAEEMLNDKRVALTMDGGGSSLRFSAMRAGKQIVDTITTPSYGDDLERCLAAMIDGFKRARAQCELSPVAISLAFPGPSPYGTGIVGDLENLPAFRGGVALGPMLEEHFQLPVFIHNDGDMFAYGEAIAGLLPWVNEQLARAGLPKRYRNLFGVTLGTGFGSGLVSDGRLLMGDNSMAGEIWLMRNKLAPERNAEEGASIRAVRRVYARVAGVSFEAAPDPEEIARIASGEESGDRAAALEAFRALGEVVGDAIANAMTLFDSLVVIGGGLSGAGAFFLPPLVAELNGCYQGLDGKPFRRLTQEAVNLETSEGLKRLLAGDQRQIPVPGSTRSVPYDVDRLTGVGLSKLGTSRAIAIGSYARALRILDSTAHSKSFA